MNEIVNKFLLAGHKFLPEMHLKLDLHVVFVGQLQKTKKEYKNFRKQYIYDILVKTS